MAKLSVKVTINERVNRMPRYTRCAWPAKSQRRNGVCHLEPCSHHGRTPPCCDALIAAGVARVVAAMQDPNPQVAGRGLYRLQQAGIDVSHGLMMSEAEQLNKGFLKRMRTGFPYIQLKLGASLDGRTAMAVAKASGSLRLRRDATYNDCARKVMPF